VDQAVGAAAAFGARRLLGRRGAGPLQRLAARHLPEAGVHPGRFGRDRVIQCDLAVGYDRSVYLGREECTELRVMCRLLRRGDTFVDCGANLGLFTVFAAERVGPEGRVVSVEAVPATASRLAENVKLSRLGDGVVLVQRALDEESGTSVRLSGSTHNVIRIGDESCTQDVEAPTVTLDEIFEEYGRIAGIKVDVEGHELPVLTGARTLIEHCNPWMLVEFNTAFTGSDVLGDWPVFKHMARLGYSAHYPRSLILRDRRPLVPEWRCPGPYVNILFSRPALDRQTRKS